MRSTAPGDAEVVSGREVAHLEEQPVFADISITAKYSDEILMMSDGKIYAYGAASEVIIEENLSAVYGVKAKIIDDDGRPHVILKDALRISDSAACSGGSVADQC